MKIGVNYKLLINEDETCVALIYLLAMWQAKHLPENIVTEIYFEKFITVNANCTKHFQIEIPHAIVYEVSHHINVLFKINIHWTSGVSMHKLELHS